MKSPKDKGTRVIESGLMIISIWDFNSSNWGQKSKTRVSYWWRCISLFAHVFSVKTSIHSPTIHSETWKLKQNKCTHKCSKKETHHESEDLNRISSREFTCLPLFALLVTHKEKNVSLACWSIWKRSNSRQPVFRPEVTLAPSTRKQPVREAKFNLKNYTGWNASSYIYMRHCPIGSDCRIHRLLLCRGVNPPPTSVLYVTKQSDCEVPVILELWGMWSTPLLPLSPSLLWPGVVALENGPIYGLNRTKPWFLDFTDFCI